MDDSMTYDRKIFDTIPKIKFTRQIFDQLKRDEGSDYEIKIEGKKSKKSKKSDELKR